MMLQDIENHVEKQHLTIFGGVNDDLAEGIRTLLLLGPLEPGFWACFTGSQEYGDGRADPLDRWSERVIGDLANTLNAKAFFRSADRRISHSCNGRRRAGGRMCRRWDRWCMTRRV